ncbi:MULTISPECIES: helix-turn-helix transcriptional regulator [Cupriavidus]|jgi:transcriptional regulator with XRE-family HTH domain|uniref:Helix-turn-helix transcriptional regulator n=1 Tax=Cupriavidus campinensis TaxID=151783 RepID=A0ABY3EMG8_9BURK|nr:MULTISPECIES: helix-turn-helix transcriptional regulator [Cupriavidus]MCA3774941.1 helix-turn-helix transcriptional regulator [Cutibacterium sp.]MCA3183181.1 helix-turn-helix transcriptional regulator [Cupriavidus sp.]MCA3191621.1 helix-turn-helix transcriptional regulator [Cupriavidus sp.]MCA3199784.1 helix-turn-helix transcriptional regulator [Cupriavidus sp.]MCA3205480.1 helix-turn-helix transcriptional regulator [Cupriavidus sp.]
METLRSTTPVLERQLLLQLGDRIKRLRKAKGLTTIEMARRVGVSRTTLTSVEAGDPTPSIGTYLRVMSVLGVAGDLAMLVSDTFQPAPPGSASANTRRATPQVQVFVRSDPDRHQAQDLQSLALHEEAVRLLRTNPELVDRVRATLAKWLANGPSRSESLWREWENIIAHNMWRKALGRTKRAQELRQASPLPTVLPDDVRQRVIFQVRALKKGGVLGDVAEALSAEGAR